MKTIKINDKKNIKIKSQINRDKKKNKETQITKTTGTDTQMVKIKFK